MAVDYQGGNDTILSNFFGGITNTYAREQARIARQQQEAAKQAQANQKELSDIVKKVNVSGVQPQDAAALSTKLSDLYDTYYKANKAQSTEDRLKLRLDLERKITDMGDFVSSSKQRGTAQVKLAEDIAKNPALFSPEKIAQFKSISEKPTLDLDANAFSPEAYVSPDTSYLDKTIDASAKSLLANANKTRRVGGAASEGNKSGVSIFNEQIVPKDAFATDLFRQYQQDVKFKNLTDYTAAQMGIQPDQYILAVVDEYAKANKLSRSEQGFSANNVPRKSGSGDEEDESLADQGVLQNYAITYGTKNIEGTDSKQSALTASNFAHLPSSKVVLAGTYNMIDAESGAAVKAPKTSTEFKRVGYGYFPVAAKDFKTTSGKTVKAGAPLTESFATKNPSLASQIPKVVVQQEVGEGRRKKTNTYLVDPREAIAISKMTKAEKAVKAAVDKAQGSTPAKSAPATSQPAKSAPASKKKAIPGF